MNDTVILLGYRDGIVTALAEQNYQIIYIVEKFRPALAGERYFIINNLEDAQEVLRCVLSLDLDEVIGIVTGLEKGVFAAALLRDMLVLPGPKDYRSTLYFRDKYLQKNKLSNIMAHADCRYINRGSEYAQLRHELGTPFIIKPSNGMGSFATTAVGSEPEYQAYLQRYVKDACSVAYVAEKKINAPEYCVDGIWSDGKLRWFSISQYPTSPLQCNEEKLPSIQILSKENFPDIYQTIEEFCPRALAHLKASNGVFHLEFFKEDEEILFSECALRPAGARIPEMIKLAYGIDLYAAHTKLSLGFPCDLYQPELPVKPHAVILLRSFEGVTLTKEDFYNNFDLVDLNWTEDAGQQSHGSHGCTGYAIIAHNDHRILKDNIDKLIAFTGA